MKSINKISINKDIKSASSLPPEFYLNNIYYQLVIKKIFNKSWQYITDVNSLISINQFPFVLLENSVNEHLVLTQLNQNFLCLSNVCTHRGNIICQNNCSGELLKCGYHGRKFKLNGKMHFMPGFEKVKNFPTKDDNLNKLPIKIWKNFIFISMNPSINMDKFFSDVENRLGWYSFDKLKYDKKKSATYEIEAHWALYCENYLEGFHVPYIHQGLNSKIKYSSYKTELIDNVVLQYTNSESEKDALPIPKGFKNHNKNIYAYYYWIFPNMMFNFYSWGLSINIIEPINNKKSRIKFLSYPITSKTQPKNSNDSLDTIEKEDQKVVLKVQQGIQSKFYKRGRYSPEYEKGVHYFHRLICKYIN